MDDIRLSDCQQKYWCHFALRDMVCSRIVLGVMFEAVELDFFWSRGTAYCFRGKYCVGAERAEKRLRLGRAG